MALSVLFLKLRLITGEIAAQLFILTAALLAPIRMFDAEHDLPTDPRAISTMSA